MYVFYPKQIPELEVYYNVIPEQKGTWQDPQIDSEIEFQEIEIAGVPISIELYELFLREYEEKWIDEIKGNIKMAKERRMGCNSQQKI